MAPSATATPVAPAATAATAVTAPAAVTAPVARPIAIGVAAERLGISPRSLRYYEQVGLLTPSGRTEGGNRLYSDEDLARVARIREMQELLGADLDTIRSILDHEDRTAAIREAYAAGDGDRTALLHEALALHTGLIEQVDAKLARLHELRDGLEARRTRVTTLLADA
jgi:DNA-binding transcriptional MerR regulator